MTDLLVKTVKMTGEDSQSVSRSPEGTYDVPGRKLAGGSHCLLSNNYDENRFRVESGTSTDRHGSFG